MHFNINSYLRIIIFFIFPLIYLVMNTPIENGGSGVKLGDTVAFICGGGQPVSLRASSTSNSSTLIFLNHHNITGDTKFKIN